MPMYDWKCRKCQATDAIVADVEHRDVAPIHEEGLECDGGGEHEWTRVIGAPKTTFGAGWSSDGRSLKGRH